MTADLVLSIYPGIDLLGRAFEAEGYTVVRGPDPLWGGDIRTFHPPAGVFGGVIGGPPCQHWTRLMFLNKDAGKGLDWVVSEFARVVEEAQPVWFLIEEVPYAPMPLAQGYHDYDVVLRDYEVGGVQPRQRRFTFGTRDCRMLNVIGWERVKETALSVPEGRQRTISGHLTPGQRRRTVEVLAERKQGGGRAVPVRIGGNGKEKRSITSAGPGAHGGGRAEGWEGGRLPGRKRKTVTSADTVSLWDGHRTPIEDACEAQGLPRDFTDHMPFTKASKQLVIGNGVSMALGRAVAQAVRRALS